MRYSHKEKKRSRPSSTAAVSNYGAVSRDQVDAWVAQMNEAGKDEREPPPPPVRQQAVDTKKATARSSI
ncbi:hypothetical protein P4110_11215 [Pseudomonas aeruginosa]|nr:hypothetical protein [Pseudomonas aeruginosa]